MRDLMNILTKPETNGKNPDDPATFNLERWASEILVALQDLKGLDLNLDETRRVLVKFPANNTDYVPVTFDQPAEYVYIPSSPRNMTIHFGTGPGQIMATIGVGEPLRMRFPRIDAMTFVPDAGTGNADQFDLWYSTRPIEVDSAAVLADFTEVVPGDAVANPTAIPEMLAFMMGWDSAATVWRRVQVAGATAALRAAILTNATITDGAATLMAPGIDIAGNTRFPAIMPYVWNGASADRPRIPFVFKPFAATAIVAGTGLTVWTPAAGKKFRLMGWSLSTATAADLIFGDNAVGTVIYRTGVQQINTTIPSPPIGNGILSAAANNVLKLDVSVGATVGGTVWGTEE